MSPLMFRIFSLVAIALAAVTALKARAGTLDGAAVPRVQAVACAPAASAPPLP